MPRHLIADSREWTHVIPTETTAKGEGERERGREGERQRGREGDRERGREEREGGERGSGCSGDLKEHHHSYCHFTLLRQCELWLQSCPLADLWVLASKLSETGQQSSLGRNLRQFLSVFHFL